ncbi:MAG TPA: hypothetical protein VFO10_18285 [Oligoflexus sp.]|uniref:hypothetical protein n=1 Tax=Oligoflexus sp. TaxID=1971216 RepID=UPI002D80067F|nr:hypothetical protein [Oligoflexus sp.]HET9239215.1 hypothetical protein [Oligoflexus sp.]
MKKFGYAAPLLMLFCFGWPILANSQDQSCRSEKPWLSETCEEPNGSDINHACRFVMKKEKESGWKKEDFAKTLHHKLMYETCEGTTRLTCSTFINNLVVSYDHVLKTHFDEPKSDLPLAVTLSKPTAQADYNLERNFLWVKEAEGKSLDKIRAFIETSKSKATGITDDASLRKVSKEIDANQRALKSELLTLSRQETDLLRMLRNAVAQMQIVVGNSRQLVPNKCRDVNDKIEKYNQDTLGFIYQTHQLIEYIEKASKEVSDLYVLAIKSSEITVRNRYAAAVKDTVESATDRINQVLFLDRTLWDVASWWYDANKNGLANRLHTRYLLYTEPMRLLNIELQTAQGFRTRLSQAVPNAGPLRDETLRSIDDKIQTIQDEIDALKKKGFEGQLASQISLARRRLAAVGAENANCKKVSDDFLAKAEKVKSLADFEQTSYLYATTVETCVRNAQ